MQKKQDKEKPKTQKICTDVLLHFFLFCFSDEQMQEQQLNKVVEEDMGAKEKEQDKGMQCCFTATLFLFFFADQQMQEQQLNKVVEEKDMKAKEKETGHGKLPNA